ncbi:coenzyme F420-0:L-glutamate ligase [Marisediminicola senii]|uniref:coenzyme F420-0:L-glutamate ligase n=1 Tax=Marisediminicola senii TaxID=2711233 RepID=UPI0013EBD87B|nr:coenzyme F420-0:L-glutamate ligase [Marisediminicola senii]
MFSVWAVEGIGEIVAGDDLARLIGDAVGSLEEGDIVSVTSKIVSKAEGRTIAAADRENAITAETVRLVASRTHPNGVTRIVENRLGLVMAAAGVDGSNTPEGTVLLLPLDPDASAHAICRALRERFGVPVGVVITDTLGRPWRDGQTDVAIGAAGLRVIDDLRGTTDANGRPLNVTLPAVADELAGATDLVKGKADGLPVAVVRGLGRLVADLDEPGAARLIRPAENDMFRLGSDEAHAEGHADGHAEGHAAGRADGYAAGLAAARAERAAGLAEARAERAERFRGAADH